MEVQYRYGLDSTCYEICAGAMEEGETPEQAARRELEEETGFTGGEWMPLMTISGNASVTSNITHCFVAKGVRRTVERHLDSTEDLDVELLTEDEVLGLLMDDKVKQSLMAAPLWRWMATVRGLV